MASTGKETPRQKMINLMYLVYISMLAMQIDQEIIRSYFDTNSSLQESRRLTENKNDNIFEKTLQAKAQDNEAMAGNYEAYQGLKGNINKLVGFIEGVKTKMKQAAGYDEKEGVESGFSALNNAEASSNEFFDGGNEESPSKTALELKKQMDDLRNYISKSFADAPEMKNLIDRANQTLITEFPKDKQEMVKTGWYINSIISR